MTQQGIKIITFSFDDGEVQDVRLCNTLRQHGIKASFSLRSRCCGLQGDLFNADGTFFRHYSVLPAHQIPQVYQGFEICSHGATHSDFSTLNFAQMQAEVGADCQFFAQLTGNPVVGAIYPGGNHSASAVQHLQKLGIKFCRTADVSAQSTAVPDSWLVWHPTCHFLDADVLDVVNRFAQNVNAEPQILHVFGHSYELDLPNANGWQRLNDLLVAVKKVPNALFLTLGETYNLLCGK